MLIKFSIWTQCIHYKGGTYKSGGIVVPDGLGIAKGLQGRIGLDDLILQSTL